MHWEPMQCAHTCSLFRKMRIVLYTAIPIAGLPNPLAPTGYDEKPADTAGALFTFAMKVS